MDQGIVVAEGRREEDLLRIVTNLAFPRLLPSKTIYVSDDTSFSMWYGRKGSLSDVRVAVAELARMRLIRQNKGRFTCTEYGRLTVDREIPFSKIDLNELQKWVETEIPQPEHYDELKREREAYARNQVLELVSRYGWTTVQWSARQLLDTNVTEVLSLWKARAAC